MLRKALFSFILLSFSIPGVIFCQDPGIITGLVQDSKTADRLQRVNITLKGSSIGAVTDDNGKFTMNAVPAGNQTLLVSMIGYGPQQERVAVSSGQSSYVSIDLIPDPISMEEILVTGAQDHAGPNVRLNEDTPKDIGEFFRKLPGCSAVKKGNFAMDPVIRSFKYDQLNIQFDGGIRCFGGCPNRMDPPTSHVQSEDLEKIELVKGPFSVRFGQAMGGVVNLVMKRPRQTDSFRIHGKLESRYETNGDNRRGRITVYGGEKKIDFYAGGGVKDYGNYKTGAGNETPSSFDVTDYSLKVGFMPHRNHRIQVSWRQSFVGHVDYPALPMDADSDDTDIIALDYSARCLNSRIISVNAKLYRSDVAHVMSNTNRKNYEIVHAVTDATADTYGGRGEIDLVVSKDILAYVGADYYRLRRDGIRTRDVYKMGEMTFDPPKHFDDYVWQDSSIEDMGFFSEWHFALSPGTMVTAGARIDLISSDIKDPSPQFLEEYGQLSTFEETNIGGNISVARKISGGGEVKLSMGRGTRTADLGERYINHLPIGYDAHEHFGNPHLNPEINHQIEIGLGARRNRFDVQVNIFYSLLKNFIFADVDSGLPRLYMPGTPPEYAKRFYNIENANQIGFEILINGVVGHGLSYQGDIAYTRAQNDDLDEPLPEVIPLESHLALRFDNDDLWGELSARVVADQNRISDTFGETMMSGFSVFAVRAGATVFRTLELMIGVENIFDRNYYEHLSRRYKNQPDSFMVHEPGRNIILQASIGF
ncbi:MAG: hypothetical protein B6244_02680 [Candidatus Cloacimonetes bacterium 4572_55]|nr:MAG: hypothetical protein B6244_02680 [Candidatus Cloacimonetes bacterium 4572_55]